jgi:hypothetical protein
VDSPEVVGLFRVRQESVDKLDHDSVHNVIHVKVDCHKGLLLSACAEFFLKAIQRPLIGEERGSGAGDWYKNGIHAIFVPEVLPWAKLPCCW